MKRFICLILCVLVVLSVTAPAMARGGASTAKVTYLTGFDYDSILQISGKIYATKTVDTGEVDEKETPIYKTTCYELDDNGTVVKTLSEEEFYNALSPRYILKTESEASEPIGCEEHEDCILHDLYHVAVYDTVEKKALTDYGFLSSPSISELPAAFAIDDVPIIDTPDVELTNEHLEEIMTEGIILPINILNIFFGNLFSGPFDGLFLKLKKEDGKLYLSVYSASTNKLVVEKTEIPARLLEERPDPKPTAREIADLLNGILKDFLNDIDLSAYCYYANQADLADLPDSYILDTIDALIAEAYAAEEDSENPPTVSQPEGENPPTGEEPEIPVPTATKLAIYYFDTLFTDIFDMKTWKNKVSVDFDIAMEDSLMALDFGMSAFIDGTLPENPEEFTTYTTTVYDCKGDIVLKDIDSISVLKTGLYVVGKSNEENVFGYYALAKITDMPLPLNPNTTTLSDGTNNIKITAGQNVLPLQSKLKVVLLSSGDKFNTAATSLNSYEKFTAYDISLLVASAKVQPNGKIKISLPIPAGYDKTRISIAYVDDNGKVTTITSTINGEFIEFETDHLSTYAVVQAKTPVPATGDNLILFIVLGSLAILLAIFGVIKNRKEQQK